jgi:murein DD-endopeptidase MepM/ murein hydrolase activator NlpD
MIAQLSQTLLYRLSHVHQLGWLLLLTSSLSISGNSVALAQAQPNAVTILDDTASQATTDIVPIDTSSSSSIPISDLTEPTTSAPTLPIISPSDQSVRLNSTDSSDPYIDTTDYSIGATRYNEEPTIATTTTAQSDRSTWNPNPANTNASISLKNRSGNFNPTSTSLTYLHPGSTNTSGRYYYRRNIQRLTQTNGSTSLIFPLSIPAPITSFFGWRVHPITGDRRFHSGTDIGAPLGTPVLAAYAGKVAIADFLGGYGLAIALEHKNATQETFYAHLSEILVKPGQWVKQGELIGRVGSTGNSTGPHLHFELRQQTSEGWVAVDPGMQLEYALAQLVQSLQTAQSTSQPSS